MYAIDLGRRMWTVFFLVCVLAAAIVLGVNRALQISAQMASIVALVIFLMFFYAFDRFLWKLPGFRILGNGIVDIAGEWTGTISRVHQGSGPDLSARLIISQTWSMIGFQLITDEAVSQALMAHLLGADPSAIKVAWIYQFVGSNARSLADAGQGVVELTLTRKTGVPTLTGNFFSSQLDDELSLRKV